MGSLRTSAPSHSFITSPIDLIKIRQQLSYSAHAREPSTVQVVRDIWRKGGVRGIYRGLGSTCVRDIGYGPYFVAYEVINRFLLSTKTGNDVSLSNLDLALSGGLAGIVGWLSTFGADVIKTRVQATSRRPGVRSAFLSAAADTYREGGWRAFFAGVGPTILRALPVNAVLVRELVVTWSTDCPDPSILLQFITFEATKSELTRQGW